MPSVCRHCQAPVVKARLHPHGEPITLDAKPRRDGRYRLEEVGLGDKKTIWAFSGDKGTAQLFDEDPYIAHRLVCQGSKATEAEKARSPGGRPPVDPDGTPWDAKRIEEEKNRGGS